MPTPSAQFTTRARVVDLLGREQIADAPTAMGEIFKNALDAAASNVRLDYWDKERCLSVGDDGLGMRTHEEVIQKWLVLATESKQQPLDVNSSWLACASPEQKRILSSRRPYGKKGIGRLAIALLGSGTLIWTRWGKGGATERTLIFVPWTIFRHPRLTLEQIQIPMVVLSRTATVDDALKLIQQTLDWVHSARIFKEPWALKEQALKELEELFPLSLRAPIEFSNTTGTQFVTLNVDDMVPNHFEGWLGRSSIFGSDELPNSEGPKAYLAFNNPFVGKQSERLSIKLFHNGKRAKLDELGFWNPEDFSKADHCITVSVDENGFAQGTIRRFSEKITYERQLAELPSRSRSPGSFSLKVGYIEGSPENTRLSTEDFSEFDKRLDAFGGFYVYMDDVRVCPYGRDDSDFLEFEKRRSFNAGRHFWSHRRMFGGLFLHLDRNSDLVEKAGREGFQQNGAYRGLIFLLKSLFIDLADSYFGRKSGRQDKADKKEEKRKHQREEKHQQLRKEYLSKFKLSKKLLPTVTTRFSNYAQEVEALLAKAAKAKTLEAMEACVESLGTLRGYFERMWEDMVTSMPKDFSLEADDSEAVDAYLHERLNADTKAQRRLASIAERIERLSVSLQKTANRRDAGRRLLQEASTRFAGKLREAVLPVIKAEERLRGAIEKKPETDLAELEHLALEICPAIAKPDVHLPSGVVEETVARQARLVQEKQLPYYDLVRRQLDALAEGDSDLIEAADLRDELRILRDREVMLMELAQLGLVMEAADHDYHGMMADVATELNWIDKSLSGNAKARLQRVKDYLGHLDARLQQWDPLVRRVRGRVSEISGEEIRKFVQDAFLQELRKKVKFEYTPKFLSLTLIGVKRAVFLGAIHNIVMNAGYWVEKGDENGQVRFSVHPQGFVVSDSGPGVNERDHQRIFEPGFSRRPAGRGLGLYIARSCLRSMNYELELLPLPATGALRGANFLIQHPKSDE